MPAETVTTPDSGTPSINDSATSSVTVAIAATTALTSAAIAGRVALQGVPSVEPILAAAVAAGFYGGWKHGFASGSTAYYVSNFFVWGAQGPWTVFQCLGAGLAGALAGKIGLNADSRTLFVSSLIAGTVMYEITVNLGSALFTPWALGMGASYFLAAVPFAAVHLASTVGFGVITSGFSKQLEKVY